MIYVSLYYNKLTEKDLQGIATLPLLLQDRINKHKRLKSRLNSLAGYLLLQHTLEEQGQTLEQLDFSATGKPYLSNSPFSFSISHNAGWVGLCWMPVESKLGLDIQEFRKFEPIESAFSFFSAVEQEAILTSKEPNQTLIHYWAKKEALIKAGAGRMFDEAALTNTTLSHCTWKGENYQWLSVPSSFDGAIWIACNQPFQKISVKKVTFL